MAPKSPEIARAHRLLNRLYATLTDATPRSRYGPPMKTQHTLACALVLSTLLPACVPITPYRYTGMTPAAHPIAWDGYPSHKGLHGELSMSHTEVNENLLPQLHDTALHVAATTIEGHAAVTPIRGLDIGARVSYSAFDFTAATA